MKNMEKYNPIAVAVYFLTVSGIAMFCLNPILLSLSLIGAVFFFIMRNGRKHMKSHLGFLGLFCIMAIINPFFSHNGVTVLFVLNDKPITLEAFLYGVTASMMIMATLYWFRCFTQIMTSEKLLYIFGKISPKFALILSMSLRYVPLFTSQTKKIDQTQTALGLYKEDNIIDRIRGKLRIFSVLLTWGIENGIVTADSMSARGYGTQKRSHFSIFRFQKTDVLFLMMTLLFGLFTCISLGIGALDVTFYPTIKFTAAEPMSYMGYCSYTLLVCIPILIETEEKIRWKYLKSKI